ncbi:type VI secretion protein [Parashewanella curva]|uniref:Type VI secretion protein n=1 Tax=Parashewanella curva TaxID=2338552 RepID=A0A3L8Q0T2_9GAMM|nr:type VI secretion system contractile sheath large subunit [Parashewanella curva]RLV61241.1 type VI secretion protein [Parashewanella curva]
MTHSYQNVTLNTPQTSKLWAELGKHSNLHDVDKLKVTVTLLIAQLDKVISAQLSEVIQHPHFKMLEACWLGLKSLTSLNVSLRRVKVRLLDLSWEQVSADMNLSFDVRHTALYRKIYSQELDTAGGTPYGILLIDHLVKPDYVAISDYDDLYTLQLLSELGEQALCPILLGLDEFFFGDDPKRQMQDPARIDRILESPDYQSWHLLRNNNSSRFLHLVMPELFLRAPYQNYNSGFIFSEADTAKNSLWGNCSFMLTANAIKEFDRISWFGFLRSYNSDGVSGALVSTSNDEPVVTKIDLHSEEDGFWAEHGFVSLSSLYLTEQKGFFSNQSVWNAKSDAERILGMLQTNLMACRFGHYIKTQTRDQVGGYDSVHDCQKRIERWLQKYISGLDYGEDSVMARYPLKSCEVKIEADPLDKTRYFCQIRLQPQYQYELMDVEVLLSTTLSNQDVGEAA